MIIHKHKTLIYTCLEIQTCHLEPENERSASSCEGHNRRKGCCADKHEAKHISLFLSQSVKILAPMTVVSLA